MQQDNDLEHEKVTTYQVEKFFPPRCPNCENAFQTPDDFFLFFGENNSAKGYTLAQANWMERWPELNKVEPDPQVMSLLGKKNIKTIKGNQYDIDFIICSKCKNVTMRIKYANRQVLSLVEAQRLVMEEGFTSISASISVGNMAHPISKLSWLAQSDLLMLENAVNKGRAEASDEKNERIAGDIFGASVDKALSEIIKKNAQAAHYGLVLNELQGIFGKYWVALEPDARDFLITAELTNYELSSLAESSDSVDFSAVVSGYSKALERTLLVKLFDEFKESPFSVLFPADTGRKSIDESIGVLRKYVDGTGVMTMGSMVFCLVNVGDKIRNTPDNGFAQYLKARIVDIDEFIKKIKFPARLDDYVKNYRNKSAHVSKITKQECNAARAFLLEEPIKLLILLEERLKPIPEE